MLYKSANTKFGKILLKRKFKKHSNLLLIFLAACVGSKRVHFYFHSWKGGHPRILIKYSKEVSLSESIWEWQVLILLELKMDQQKISKDLVVILAIKLLRTAIPMQLIKNFLKHKRREELKHPQILSRELGVKVLGVFFWRNLDLFCW